MPVTHTNRKGKTYYLHEGVTPRGNPKYYFSPKSEGRLAGRMPEGYEIYENPNAQVFLRKVRPKLITDDESRLVKDEMGRHPHLHYCRCDVKGKLITVFEPNQDVAGMLDLLSRFGTVTPAKTARTMEEILSFSPTLRFALVDQHSRTFQTERYCFRGRINDWIEIGSPGTLDTLAPRYVRHVGRESFFDFM